MLIARLLPAACILMVGAMTGCGKTVTRTILRPAEINMAGRETVLLEPVQGRGGEDVHARLKQALLAKGFKVVDRGSLLDRAREEEIRQRQNIDNPSGGQITTANVRIAGRMLEPRHHVRQTTGVITYGNGQKVQGYGADVEATVQAAFDVTDLETATLITTKIITATQKGKIPLAPTPPAHIDPSSLYQNCYPSIVQQFMAAIAPHEVRVNVRLHTVDKNPANDAGIVYFEQGDYPRAIERFTEALQIARLDPKSDAKTISQVTHNLGLCYEFNNQFDAALQTYREVIRLDANNTDAQASIRRTEMTIRDQTELRNQGVDQDRRNP